MHVHHISYGIPAWLLEQASEGGKAGGYFVDGYVLLHGDGLVDSPSLWGLGLRCMVARRRAKIPASPGIVRAGGVRLVI